MKYKEINTLFKGKTNKDIIKFIMLVCSISSKNNWDTAVQTDKEGNIESLNFYSNGFNVSELIIDFKSNVVKRYMDNQLYKTCTFEQLLLDTTNSYNLFGIKYEPLLFNDNNT